MIKNSDVGQKQTYKTSSQISPADPEKTLHQLHEQYDRMKTEFYAPHRRRKNFNSKQLLAFCFDGFMIQFFNRNRNQKSYR